MHQTTKTRLLTTLLLASAAQPLQSMDYAYNILYGAGIVMFYGITVRIAFADCLLKSKPCRRTFFSINSQLCHAICSGDLDEVKYLVKQGADINKYDTIYTPLSTSIIYNQPQIIDYLVEQGVDLDGTDYIKFTLACNGPLQKIVELGAPINNKSSTSGDALLHFCVEGWYPLKHTRSLIEYGADISIKDCDGNTALDIARKEMRLEIVDYLHNTRDYLINRIILTKKDSTTPNYGLLALRTFNHCDISFLRGDSSVDLPHLIKVWQWHKQEHFTSDIKSSLREMIWIDLDNKTTTPDTLEKNIVKISERHKVAFCYNLHRKILRREQQKQKSADVYFSFKHQ